MQAAWARLIQVPCRPAIIEFTSPVTRQIDRIGWICSHPSRTTCTAVRAFSSTHGEFRTAASPFTTTVTSRHSATGLCRIKEVTCMSRRNYVIVLASVYLVSAIAIGNPASAPLDPNVLASEIRSRGAKVVADGLGDQEWLRVQKGVETGAQPWLRVASALHK